MAGVAFGKVKKNCQAVNIVSIMRLTVLLLAIAAILGAFPSAAYSDPPTGHENYLVQVACAQQRGCLWLLDMPQSAGQYFARFYVLLREASAIPQEEKINFAVTTTRAPNAWALKHYFGVTAGLVLELRPTDDELAFAMAHELAHIELGHYDDKLREITKIYTVAAVMLLLSQGRYDPTRDPFFVIGTRIALAAYSREKELEADARAVDLMRRAGFNPRAALTLLRRIDPTTTAGAGDLFATHPTMNERISRLEALVGP